MVAVRKWRPSGDQPHVTPFSALRAPRQQSCEHCGLQSSKLIQSLKHLKPLKGFQLYLEVVFSLKHILHDKQHMLKNSNVTAIKPCQKSLVHQAGVQCGSHQWPVPPLVM